MIERKKTTPTVWANGLWNIFTQRKKYKIQCGECQHSYCDKVPFYSDTASSICSCCGAQNIWSHSEFNKHYDIELSKNK